MDRAELRFRILFEYYNELHSEPLEGRSRADTNIQKLTFLNFEVNAAKVWLIDSGYLDGNVTSALGYTGPYPIISRINSNGINFVEMVMDKAFTQIKDEFKDIKALSKTDRIIKFSKECLNNPTVQGMCQATYSAIVELMSKSGAN